MIERLFWKDPYMKECEAIVTSKMGPEIKLDRTIFFAFSGGQSSDEGTIGGIKVKEAVKSDNEITYVLEKVPDFNEGDSIKIEIDWEKRHKIMRLHSAAHIIFYLFSQKTGINKLIGSNISLDKARLDFATETPITPLLPEIEQKANEVFGRDIEIRTYGDAEDENKRLWEIIIDGKDVNYPCGGTHVKSTKEIGKVALKRKNIGKGKERIEIMIA
jgi:Ser-tRNA(Ala) deacylase AlaX